MKWDGFKESDKKAQLQGFDTTIGDTGYLREAYHGDPYPTHFLLKEAFDFEYPEDYDEYDEDLGYVRIPADLLVERLPETIRLSIERERNVYNADLDKSLPIVKSYMDFVALAVRLEREGKNPRIHASY